MSRIRTSLAAFTATAVLALPGAALAADRADTAKTKPTCASVVQKHASKLTGDERSRLTTACTTRDRKIDAARKDREEARASMRSAVKTAKTTFRAAVKAAKTKPAAERAAARKQAAEQRRAAIKKARSAFVTEKKEAKKAVRGARSEFRKVLRSVTKATQA